MRKLTTDEIMVMGCTVVGSACMVAGLAGRFLEKRREKRKAEAVVIRRIKLAHALEILEMLDEDLNRKLDIARAVALEFDLEEIFKDFKEGE